MSPPSRCEEPVALGDCHFFATAQTPEPRRPARHSGVSRPRAGHQQSDPSGVRCWVALREIEPDYARLANTAAVNRWELMRLAKQTERLQPPRIVGGTHRHILAAVTSSARACQLLAN